MDRQDGSGRALSRIFQLMVGKGLYPIVLGMAIGLLAASCFTSVLASMLVKVKPTEPLTFVFVSVLFLLIAVIASWLPAQRAAGLDPTTVLRNEVVNGPAARKTPKARRWPQRTIEEDFEL